MTRFRPCIDLHDGKVKQIVGSTLRDDAQGPSTNFVSEHSSAHFATLYRRDGLGGGHVIMLGPGNESAALEALRAFPGGLQLGGGIRPKTAHRYLEAGASQVIVTSYLFEADGRFREDRLTELSGHARQFGDRLELPRHGDRVGGGDESLADAHGFARGRRLFSEIGSLLRGVPHPCGGCGRKVPGHG